MKKVFSIFYRALCHFSLAFSGILIFFWAVMKRIQYIDHERTPYIDHENISAFLTFAVIFGVTSFIFAIPKLPYVLKVILHFILNAVSFVLNLAVVDGVTPVRLFVVTALFAVLYFVIFAISKILGTVSNKKEID